MASFFVSEQAEAQSANGDAKSAGESYKKAISAAGMEKLELLQVWPCA
jgi:hypothetical protein